MAAKKSDPDQYTKPELRDKIKEQVTKGDKGGKPGQWSARKAQLVTQEYEKEGGDYKHPRSEAQQSLKDWGDEKWKTSDGKPAERKEGTTRYLPETAWDKLSDEEKAATNKKKQSGSKEGKQFVANTSKAAEARRESTKSGAKKASSAKSGTKAVARKKAATKSSARAAAKAESKRSSQAAKKAPAKAAKKAPAKSTAEADRKAAQKKKAMTASRKAAAKTRKRAAERASRKG